MTDTTPDTIRRSDSISSTVLRAYLRTIDRANVEYHGIVRAIELADTYPATLDAVHGSYGQLPAGHPERPGLAAALNLLTRGCEAVTIGRCVLVAINDGPDRVTIRTGVLHPSERSLRVVLHADTAANVIPTLAG